MTTYAWLDETLRAAFAPCTLQIEDESSRHAGHPGAAGGGGHFRVLIVSDRFCGLDALQRQRNVYAVLGEAMGGRIHALAMRTLTPREWRRETAAMESQATGNHA